MPKSHMGNQKFQGMEANHSNNIARSSMNHNSDLMITSSPLTKSISIDK